MQLTGFQYFNIVKQQMLLQGRNICMCCILIWFWSVHHHSTIQSEQSLIKVLLLPLILFEKCCINWRIGWRITAIFTHCCPFSEAQMNNSSKSRFMNRCEPFIFYFFINSAVKRLGLIPTVAFRVNLVTRCPFYGTAQHLPHPSCHMLGHCRTF